MRKVIEQIVDDAHFLEMQSLYAPNVIIGYGRVEGHTVGIVANQPMQFAGTLDIAASEKAARFVRHCDAFNVPIITLVDVPGLPARQGPGVPGHHPPRRQAAVRLRRGHRAQADRHHPQGLWRGVHRDGLQEARRGPQPGLAHRPDRRHGRPGRGQHPLPPRPRRGGGGRRRRRGQARGGRSASTRKSCSTRTRPPSWATSTPSSPRPRPGSSSSGACAPCGTSGPACPPRSTGTSRCERRTSLVGRAGMGHGGPSAPGSPDAQRGQGQSDAEELAALTAVVLSLQAAAEEAPARPASGTGSAGQQLQPGAEARAGGLAPQPGLKLKPPTGNSPALAVRIGSVNCCPMPRWPSIVLMSV